jgi:hypothetical protein
LNIAKPKAQGRSRRVSYSARIRSEQSEPFVPGLFLDLRFSRIGNHVYSSWPDPLVLGKDVLCLLINNGVTLSGTYFESSILSIPALRFAAVKIPRSYLAQPPYEKIFQR